MIFNDPSGRLGLIQEAEDICGLGATGISGNPALFQQFTRWMNNWSKIGFDYAILAYDGYHIDDPNYPTAPTGTFTGTTNRDYNFDPSYAMLKIKLVNVSYDGVNYTPAKAFDDNDRRWLALNATNADAIFSLQTPAYDLIAQGLLLYPKFTAAQVAAGAKVYVEFFRTPKEFATTGTDTLTPGFDLQFHKFCAVGASFEYAKLYKPDLANRLAVDLYGNNANIKGLIRELEDWYSAKSPTNNRIMPMIRSSR